MENNDHKLHTTSGAGDEEDDVEDRELPHQRNLSSSIPARKSFMDRQAYWSKFDDDKKKYFHFFEVVDGVKAGAMMKIKVGVAGETPAYDSFPMFRSSKNWIMIYWNVRVSQDRWSIVLFEDLIDIEDSTQLTQQQINGAQKVIPLQEVSEVYLDPKSVTSFRIYREKEATQYTPTSPMILASTWADAIYSILQLQAFHDLELLASYYDDYRIVMGELVAEEKSHNPEFLSVPQPSQHPNVPPSPAANSDGGGGFESGGGESSGPGSPQQGFSVLATRKKSKRASILDTMRNTFFSSSAAASPAANSPGNPNNNIGSNPNSNGNSSGGENDVSLFVRSDEEGKKVPAITNLRRWTTAGAALGLSTESITAANTQSNGYYSGTSGNESSSPVVRNNKRVNGQRPQRQSLLPFATLGVLPSERQLGVKLNAAEEAVIVSRTSIVSRERAFTRDNAQESENEQYNMASRSRGNSVTGVTFGATTEISNREENRNERGDDEDGSSKNDDGSHASSEQQQQAVSRKPFSFSNTPMERASSSQVEGLNSYQQDGTGTGRSSRSGSEHEKEKDRGSDRERERDREREQAQPTVQSGSTRNRSGSAPANGSTPKLDFLSQSLLNRSLYNMTSSSANSGSSGGGLSSSMFSMKSKAQLQQEEMLRNIGAQAILQGMQQHFQQYEPLAPSNASSSLSPQQSQSVKKRSVSYEDEVLTNALSKDGKDKENEKAKEEAVEQAKKEKGGKKKRASASSISPKKPPQPVVVVEEIKAPSAELGRFTVLDILFQQQQQAQEAQTNNNGGIGAGLTGEENEYELIARYQKKAQKLLYKSKSPTKTVSYPPVDSDDEEELKEALDHAADGNSPGSTLKQKLQHSNAMMEKLLSSSNNQRGGSNNSVGNNRMVFEDDFPVEDKTRRSPTKGSRQGKGRTARSKSRSKSPTKTAKGQQQPLKSILKKDKDTTDSDILSPNERRGTSGTGASNSVSSSSFFSSFTRGNSVSKPAGPTNASPSKTKPSAQPVAATSTVPGPVREKAILAFLNGNAASPFPAPAKPIVTYSPDKKQSSAGKRGGGNGSQQKTNSTAATPDVFQDSDLEETSSAGSANESHHTQQSSKAGGSNGGAGSATSKRRREAEKNSRKGTGESSPTTKSSTHPPLPAAKPASSKGGRQPSASAVVGSDSETTGASSSNVRNAIVSHSDSSSVQPKGEKPLKSPAPTTAPRHGQRDPNAQQPNPSGVANSSLSSSTSMNLPNKVQAQSQAKIQKQPQPANVNKIDANEKAPNSAKSPPAGANIRESPTNKGPQSENTEKKSGSDKSNKTKSKSNVSAGPMVEDKENNTKDVEEKEDDKIEQEKEEKENHHASRRSSGAVESDTNASSGSVSQGHYHPSSANSSLTNSYKQLMRSTRREDHAATSPNAIRHRSPSPNARKKWNTVPIHDLISDGNGDDGKGVSQGPNDKKMSLRDLIASTSSDANDFPQDKKKEKGKEKDGKNQLNQASNIPQPTSQVLEVRRGSMIGEQEKKELLNIEKRRANRLSSKHKSDREKDRDRDRDRDREGVEELKSNIERLSIQQPENDIPIDENGDNELIQSHITHCLYQNRYPIQLSILSREILRERLLTCNFTSNLPGNLETHSAISSSNTHSMSINGYDYLTSRIGVHCHESIIMENIPQARQFAILTLSAIVAELLDSEYYIQFHYQHNHHDTGNSMHEFVFVPIQGVIAIDIDSTGSGLFRFLMELSSTDYPILHTKHILASSQYANSIFADFIASSFSHQKEPKDNKNITVAECLLQILPTPSTTAPIAANGVVIAPSATEIAESMPLLRMWLNKIVDLRDSFAPIITMTSNNGGVVGADTEGNETAVTDNPTGKSTSATPVRRSSSAAASPLPPPPPGASTTTPVRTQGSKTKSASASAAVSPMPAPAVTTPTTDNVPLPRAPPRSAVATN